MKNYISVESKQINLGKDNARGVQVKASRKQEAWQMLGRTSATASANHCAAASVG